MADDQSPDPQYLIRMARQTMSSAERRRKHRRIDFMDTSFWYETQLRFFAAGSSGAHQRLIYAGNQMGKSICVGAEFVWHCTGQYPDWWQGLRFKKPIRAWIVVESVQLGRDAIQKMLCGPLTDFGTGLVPLESFPRKMVMVPGGTGAVDTMFITHETDGRVDGVSTVTFKNFEQRRERLQSESVDLIWIDEKPPEDVYTELLARTAATNGAIMVSFTPAGEGGGMGVTYRFLSEPSADRAVFCIRPEEVRHISPERLAELAEQYPDHERLTRIEGAPALGSGPIFPVDMFPFIVKTIDERQIPPWAKRSVGIDLGYDHPFAAVYIAADMNQPILGVTRGEHIWVLNSFRVQRQTIGQHVDRIHDMTGGARVPTAYPHDAHVHDKNTGEAIIKLYAAKGLNVMATHAFNHGTKNYALLPSIEELRQLMLDQKITIDPCNRELLDELRNYHRGEDFKVVKVMDDLVSALRYAIMMRRSGRPLDQCQGEGFGNRPYAHQQPMMARTTDPRQRFAKGSANHPDGCYDLFSI
jgi:phage terminase large subunit-like protein